MESTLFHELLVVLLIPALAFLAFGPVVIAKKRGVTTAYAAMLGGLAIGLPLIGAALAWYLCLTHEVNPPQES